MQDYSRYEIYGATVPRHFQFSNMEIADKTSANFYDRGKIALALYKEKLWDSPVTVHGVNDEYYIHPGITRHLVTQVCTDKPRLSAIVINRYNCDVFKVFHDATPYPSAFNMGVFPKDYAMALKPFTNSNKSVFDKDALNDHTLCNSVPVGFDLMKGGKVFTRFGGQKERHQYEISTPLQFVEDLINHFYYIQHEKKELEP